MSRIIIAVVLALLTILPAAAQDRFNCDDFETSDRAQRILERDPTAPNGLDADNDREAYEDSVPSFLDRRTLTGAIAAQLLRGAAAAADS